MAEEDLVELKFRLFDGSSIGPFRFSPAATVSMLKQRIVTEWPKDKKIAPRTANDVKLINGGMILENSKTVAQCKMPFGDLQNGVITMHAVVQPALAKAKKECQTISIGNLLEKAEANTRRAEENAKKAADDVVAEITALKHQLTDARAVVVAAEKDISAECKVEVIREFFRSPTYEEIMKARGMSFMKSGFKLAIGQIKTLKGFVEGFDMKQLSLTLGPGILVTERAEELRRRLKEKEAQRMTNKKKDGASSSSSAVSSKPVCPPVAMSPAPAAPSVVPPPPPSRDPVSPLAHVTGCSHKRPSSSSTAAEERVQGKRPVVNVDAVEDQLTTIDDDSKKELVEMKDKNRLGSLLEKAEENIRRAQEKAKKAANDFAAEIAALKQQLADARAAAEAAEKNISTERKLEVVREFFRSPTFLKIGMLCGMVDKKYGFDLAIDQIKTLKGFVEGFDTKQLSLALGPSMEVTPDEVGGTDPDAIDLFSCLLTEREIWWVALPAEFDPSSLPVIPMGHQ